MDPTILHVAIDSFAIQAERLRCPKLIGRPVALAANDSPRPRVLAVSREARAAGVRPGTPLIVARRICRDLVPLPPDRDLYAGLGDSIRSRLAPFAPLADGSVGAGIAGVPATPYGRFILDLTGVARTHEALRDRAARAGREVERAFGLHPTLGLAATRLVSGVAAGVLAPDGELLDVRSGSEEAFLAPLSARVLPSARIASAASRLGVLNLRAVRDVQALTPAQLHAAFGALAALLWREARGLDTAPLRAVEPPPTAVTEETLASETNDRRVLALRMARLAIEICTGLRARGVVAGQLAVKVVYADGREGSARAVPAGPTAGEGALRLEATALLDRALTRRVRVRRLRLEVWEQEPGAIQLMLWAEAMESWSETTVPGEEGARTRREPASLREAKAPHSDQRVARPLLSATALESALRDIRHRLGTDALVPASWLAHGLMTRPPRRVPRRAARR